MTDSPLKYVECAVTLAEVPEEISLTISISNCAYQCRGCHSAYLRKDVGKPLQRDLDALILSYSKQITCVCLMGEGRNPDDLERSQRLIRGHGQKTCLYSGSDQLEPFKALLPLLDYLKLGAYDERLGGLDHHTTNQRFYRVERETLIDQTYLFQRRSKT